MMLNRILERQGIELSSYGLSPMDKTFIEEMISGTPENLRKGRDRKKYFLYGKQK
jgi:hypothetical protein